MTPATMCASTTAEAMVAPLITTPQTTDAARKRRIAVEACCWFSVDGNRFGYIEPNTSTATAAITTTIDTNAQPSRRRAHISATAVNSPTTATPSASHVQALPCASCVQSPKPPAKTITGDDN